MTSSDGSRGRRERGAGEGQQYRVLLAAFPHQLLMKLHDLYRSLIELHSLLWRCSSRKAKIHLTLKCNREAAKSHLYFTRCEFLSTFFLTKRDNLCIRYPVTKKLFNEFLMNLLNAVGKKKVT